MITRIIDKTVIIIFSLILQVMLYEKGVDGNTVIAFLFAVILLAVYEIKSKYVYVIIAFMVASVISHFLKISISVSCVSVYSLMACDEIRNWIKQLRFGTTNQIKNGDTWRIVISVILICGITSFEGIKNGAEYGETAILVSILSITLSLFVGIKNSISEGAKEKYYELFDEYRLESRELKKQRREAYEKNEENIYMATLKERNRIAREIHDNVGHMLTRAIVQLQALKVINDSEVTKPYIDSIDDTVNQAMLNIRKSVHELHDDSIDMSVEIAECLNALPETIKGELKTSIESAVSTDIKNICIAVVREAITNIAKYSNGTKAIVEIVEHSAFWKIKVYDNGKNEVKDYSTGMRDKSASSGMGLIGIAERVSKFDGNLNVSSNEKGFTVLVTIPK